VARAAIRFKKKWMPVRIAMRVKPQTDPKRARGADADTGPSEGFKVEMDEERVGLHLLVNPDVDDGDAGTKSVKAEEMKSTFYSPTSSDPDQQVCDGRAVVIQTERSHVRK